MPLFNRPGGDAVYRLLNTCDQMAIMPTNSVSDASAAASCRTAWITVLNITLSPEQTGNIVHVMFECQDLQWVGAVRASPVKKPGLSRASTAMIRPSGRGHHMARVRTRFPNVFVGHPFAGQFLLKKFRKIFKELPFKVIYGNTDLQTEHLLDVMRASVLKSDFSIFDLSDWNPNVALELGLAQGLKKKTGKTYYIVLNTRRSENVPSDIQGVQRLEYTSVLMATNLGGARRSTRQLRSCEAILD